MKSVWPALVPFAAVGVILLLYGAPVRAQEGNMMGGAKPTARPDESKRKADKGCVSCHAGIEVIHPWDPLSCTDCHGGNGQAREQEKAHVQSKRSVPNDERTVGLKVDPK